MIRIKSTSTDTNINVDRAYIVGLIPRRTSLYIRVDRVLTPAPLVKWVMTKSSNDIVKAIKNPERIPGIRSGSTTLKKA